MEDGSLILFNKGTLYHWNAAGKHVNQFEFLTGDPWTAIAINVYYDTSEHLYWISGVGKSQFYDAQGRKLGVAKIRKGKSLVDLAPRFFQKTKNYLFVDSPGPIDLWIDPDAPLLNKVTYEAEHDGVMIVRPIGATFCTITSTQKRFKYNYKKQFLVEDPYHGNVFVMNELENKVRQFGPDPRDPQNLVEYDTRSLSLPLSKFVPPPNGFTNATFKSREELNRWMNSWSHVNGFFLVGNDFLVGYQIPVPNDPLDNQQMIQRFTRRGKVSGRAVEIPGKLLGVYQNEIRSVAIQENGTAVIHITPL